MTPLLRVVAGLLAGACALSVGCGPQRVPLDIRFPSTETFLVSRALRVRIYDLTEGGSCSALVTAVASGRDPEGTVLFESSDLTPCAARAGASIPDVGGGLRAFLVEGLDINGNETVVAGCTEGEVFTGASIEVSVYPTVRYDAAYLADMPAAGETVESRCGGGT